MVEQCKFAGRVNKISENSFFCTYFMSHKKRRNLSNALVNNFVSINFYKWQINNAHWKRWIVILIRKIEIISKVWEKLPIRWFLFSFISTKILKFFQFSSLKIDMYEISLRVKFRCTSKWIMADAIRKFFKLNFYRDYRKWFFVNFLQVCSIFSWVFEWIVE